MEKQDIKITTTKGKQTVAAYVYGHIAVHGDFQDDRFWCVTHIPTGRLIKSFYRNLYNAQRKAEILSELNVPWESKDVEKIKQYKSRISVVLMDSLNEPKTAIK